MTSEDCNKLQVIQSSLNRLLTGVRKGRPAKNLLERTGRMSIMKMVAYHTLSMVHKVIQTGKPEYIAKKLEAEQNWKEEHGEVLLSKHLNTTLTYRVQVLFNSLTRIIREQKKTKVLKESVRIWLKVNIGVRPNRWGKCFECLLIMMFRNLDSRRMGGLGHPRRRE